ncbi:hypothetical protein ON010_g4781 [Phytophthora cinnamomi]|nr:hypothetical protein ON010_g4781 [Phytophthora cinnamomi]
MVHTLCRIPELKYDHVDAIAHRILQVHYQQPHVGIYLMKGDVKSAFRIVPVHHKTSSCFTGRVSDAALVVIDLALPFGWTGSPAYYGLFGGAIMFLVRCESPNSMDPRKPETDTFFCHDWVDDYVLVELDTCCRREMREAALRLVMMAVLGLRAESGKKFTTWATKRTALGLEWDTESLTVSMPEGKIEKTLLRIQAPQNATCVSKTELAKLLGYLRHRCTCVRAGKPFLQRLIGLWRRAPQYGKVKVSDDVKRHLASAVSPFHISRYLPTRWTASGGRANDLWGI